MIYGGNTLLQDPKTQDSQEGTAQPELKLYDYFTKIIPPANITILLAFLALVLVFASVFLKILSAEKDAFKREIVAVSNVFESHKQKLNFQLERYAASNAAYLKIDTQFSRPWIEERFATDLATVSDYDALFLITPDREIAYRNFVEQNSTAPPARNFQQILSDESIPRIQQNYLDILTQNSTQSGNFSPYVSKLSQVKLYQFGKDFALATYFAIVPDPGGIPVAQRAPYVLITLHVLDAAHLETLLAALPLEDLVLAPEIPSGMIGLPLTPDTSDPDADPAYLAWHPMAKGTSILLSSAPVLGISIGFIFLLALFSIRRSQRDRAGLKVSERQLHDAHRIAKMGRFSISSDNLFNCDEEILQLLGAPISEKISSFDDFCARHAHPDDQAPLQSAVRKCWQNGWPFGCEFRVSSTADKEITLRMQGQVHIGGTKDELQVVGMIQDISEFILLGEKLRQSQKMEAIGNLTGGIAHDFNNLLAVILGNLELIQDCETSKITQSHVEDAIRATLRAADLTQNMLTFARRAPLAPKQLELNQIIKDTRNWAGRILPETIEITTRLENEAWLIAADPSTTESTLLNLMLNARDAMPNGGSLLIETSNVLLDEDFLKTVKEDQPPGFYLMLSVVDSGQGIPEAALKDIFDPFYTTKGPTQGSGLGLSVVQGFMEQTGGLVLVQSELGAGTKFDLYFPAQTTRTAKGELPFDPAIAVLPRKGRKARILLVEDSPSLLVMLETTLSQAGHSVISATSGDHALSAFESADRFDLLLSDIVMPGQMQGTTLAHKLRAKQPSLRIILMTGHSQALSDITRDLPAGRHVLTKPIRTKDLLLAVETVLSQPPLETAPSFVSVD
ncbi:response regulator [Pseudophaeobacter flagellatus]|uniref:response regulator n=1 Tax=Pseudophaeobacter flagellatus TaxID=2899119 RepID=UPI001E419D54|nr:response regulator [Pseudophaeobacter flagellatus]